MDANEILPLIKQLNDWVKSPEATKTVQDLAERQNWITAELERLDGEKARLSERRTRIDEKDAELKEKAVQLNEKQQRLAALEIDLTRRKKDLSDYENLMAQREIDLGIKWSEAKAMKRQAENMLNGH
ncbi:MAG: hypothetical protein ACR2OV_15880 [Hyphomicrobiaceae bacterium]